MSNTKKAILIVLLILIIDQIFKIIVKTHLAYGQSIPVIGNWFILRLIENPGMAFGIDIPGKFGKLALSIFRVIAIIGIIWYLRSLLIDKVHSGLIICLSLILAGAIGNLIDSAFYGFLFDKGTIYDPALNEWISYGGVANLDFSGYSGLFKGCVVDMLYFPIIEGRFPEWFPIMKGESFVFFRPIFNIADSSISIGVIAILVFQRKFFKSERKKVDENIEVSTNELT
jgi:signal peptidase II